MSPDFKGNGATLGHCLCYTISLAIPLTAEPPLSLICHCRDCQRNAGGPSSCVLKEHIIPGSATLSGCDKVKAFCSRCDVCANSSFGGDSGKWPLTQEWFVKCRAPWLKAAEGTREFTMAEGVGL
ncbi:hypothetical protein V2W45_1520788 [Cenococcum geophilum]